MIARWYSESLLQWNPGLTPDETLVAIQSLLDLPSPVGHPWTRLEQFGMPAPDDPHPFTVESIARRVVEAIAVAGPEGAKVSAYVHGYRPADELEAILRAVLAGPSSWIWVQRYGYLSDAKLSLIARILRQTNTRKREE